MSNDGSLSDWSTLWCLESQPVLGMYPTTAGHTVAAKIGTRQHLHSLMIQVNQESNNSADMGALAPCDGCLVSVHVTVESQVASRPDKPVIHGRRFVLYVFGLV
jgi:hypothetical protein